VDEAASMKWSFFLDTKSIQAEILLKSIMELRSKNKKIVNISGVIMPMKTTVFRPFFQRKS
jgi:hypothetical protein